MRSIRTAQAFTLIELLIVVAIIAILAAIAVPNFLEAQVRAKVSRCLADTRSLATAVEAYRVDNNQYPLPVNEFAVGRLNLLSTPIPYITSIPRDPFGGARGIDEFNYAWHRDAYVFDTWDKETTWWPFGTLASRTYSEAYDQGRLWFLIGRGPNLKFDAYNDLGPLKETQYDPSNGTVSFGDIERFGP